VPCSDKSWHLLWQQFHQHQTETLRVNRFALIEVWECGGKVAPDDMIVRPPREGSTTVEVRRDALFDFLKDHPFKEGYPPFARQEQAL
jgi:hypothetical protein